MNKKMVMISVMLSVLAAIGPAAAKAQAVLDRNIMEKQCVVDVDALHVRTGPGTRYPVTGVVKRDETLDILGTMGQWYAVVLPDGSVGVVAGEFVKIRESTVAPVLIQEAEGDNEAEAISETDNDDRDRLFALVNEARIDNGLAPFKWDENLHKVAQTKAEDMAVNNYFSQHSPYYGTPFQMLKEMGVLYKTASQNIAVNKTVEDAHKKIMESMAHSASILNPRYNRMGVGVVESQGRLIIAQMFIEE